MISRLEKRSNRVFIFVFSIFSDCLCKGAIGRFTGQHESNGNGLKAEQALKSRFYFGISFGDCLIYVVQFSFFFIMGFLLFVSWYFIFSGL